MLCNLLARITRDGGHYLERHGMQKACDDADKKLVTLLSIEAAARALVKAKGRYHTEQNFKALAALFEQGEQ